MKGGFCWA